jgi:pimeloyl-ACP methyl ester carboxylesterase
MPLSLSLAKDIPNKKENVIQSKKGDYVVILHGIFRSSHHMRKLAAYLEKEGYDVINLDYPSTKYTLEELTHSIQKQIASHITEDKTVHFVGYSMGGLLLRAILNEYRPAHMGRVVQLAPPNKGSEYANFLAGNWLYQKAYGPAGQQLITDQKLIMPLFGKINYQLGVIAGSASLDPLSFFLIKGPNDGKVSILNTKVEGMSDHIVVKATHTFFPYNKQVKIQTAYFLKYGTFYHPTQKQKK